MVDRFPQPNDDSGEGYEPSSAEGSDFEAERRFARLEQIARAHVILGTASGLNHALGSEAGLTKRFVVPSQGDRPENLKGYPFAHLRVKLRPKDGDQSQVLVAALRYPTDGPALSTGSRLQFERVYIAWQLADGSEHNYVLDADGFSRLDLADAFPGDQPPWPSAASRTAADELEQFTLEHVLEDFEPDLQTRKSSVQV